MIRRVISLFFLLTAILSVNAQSAESDAAFNRGIELFRSGDFAEAARFFEQADALDRVQLDTVASSRWAYARQWAAHCHFRLGDKVKARALNKYGYEIEPVDRRLAVASDRLAENTYKNITKGDYEAAIKHGEKTLAEEIRILGDENFNVLGSYCLLADLYSTVGALDFAYQYITKALSLIKKLSPPGEQTQYYCNIGRYANIIYNSSLSTQQDREECYALLNEAAGFFSNNQEDYQEDYVGILMFISDFAISFGLTGDADSAQEKLAGIWNSMPDEQKLNYPAILKNRLNYYIYLSNADTSRHPSIEEITELSDSYLSMIKDTQGEYSEAYVDALINSANAKSTVGLSRESLKDYERSIRLLKFLYGDQDLYIYASIYSGMCRLATYISELNTAISYGNEALRVAKIFFPDDAEFQANIYTLLSNCYSIKRQYSKALEMIEQSVKLLENGGKTSGPTYCNISLAYADRLTSCNRREEALAVVDRAIADIRAQNQLFSSTYIDAVVCRLNLLEGLGRHDEAADTRQRELDRIAVSGESAPYFTSQILLNEAMNLSASKNYDRSSEIYDRLIADYTGFQWFNPQQILRLKAQNLSEQNRISEAIALYDEILATATDVDRKTIIYADVLKDKAQAYIKTGKFSLVEPTLKPALEIYREQYGEYSPQYVEIINGIANIMAETAAPDVAEKYNREALRILRKGIGENPASYLAFANLCGAKIAYLKGNYNESITLASASIAGIESLDSSYNQPLGNAYVMIGDSHQNLANYLAADEAYEKALSAFENPNGSRFNLECGYAFNRQADLHQKMGNMEKANMLRGLASDIFIELAPKESYQYAIALGFMAQKAMQEGDTESAKNFYTEMAQYFHIVSESKMNYSIDLAKIYIDWYYNGGSFDDVSEAARKVHDKLLKDDFYSADLHPNFITMLFNLEMYDEALDIARLSESKIHKIYGRTSPQAVEIYFKITDIYNKLGNQSKTAEYLGKTFSTGRDVLLGSFTTMTQEERSNFWNNYYPFFRQGLPYVCYTNPSLKDITKTAYNGTLLGTGILLEAERNLSDMIARDGSESLRQNFDAFRSTKAQFNHLSSQLQDLSDTDLLTASAQADSLNLALNRMERDLLSQVGTELGDFTGTLRIEWTDVRSALKKNDIAIEFIEFFNNDTIVTAALCLKKDFKEPKFIELFTRDASDTDFAADCYYDTALSKAIWGTLAPVIADAANIYFSTQGALCNVAIESMPMEGIIDGSRDRRFHRLSSTRELAIARKAPVTDDAVLFGGLNYDMTVDEMKADTDRYPGMKRSGTAVAGLRGAVGIPPLPGTLVEVEQIGEALENAGKANFNVRKIKGNEGTETAFKQLSGSKKRIIHIGTHGYYVSVDDMRDDDMLMRLFGESSGDNRSREDKILSRSGLFFSGAANNYRQDLSTVDGLLDDGVLTAQEISVLDLSDLDMIVLSACETARGDISGDGVFGLQRGFKKAGAGSIMMSLWKVDDEATRILMTEFYRNLADGKPKYESLELAKDRLKNDPLFNDPDYWAAFILLDAPD